jgi:glucokinase
MPPQTRALGVDIGGTKMAVAVVDARGTILARGTLATEADQGFPRAVRRLIASVEQLLDSHGWRPDELSGLGLGCAGPVDPKRGLINNPYTLTGWDGCDIVSPLHARFGRPVYLENDADAAALGECVCGAGLGFSPVVMLTFGTGIGGAVIVDDRVYRGANGEHPELGHIPINHDGPQCYCGIRGCLESLASGTAIGQAGRNAGFQDARQVFAAARQGQLVAQAIVRRAVDAAATAAWTICHTFLPQRLILGGGIMDDHFDLFAKAIAERLSAATQFSRDAVSTVRAALGNNAGVIGAASIALRHASLDQSTRPDQTPVQPT